MGYTAEVITHRLIDNAHEFRSDLDTTADADLSECSDISGAVLLWFSQLSQRHEDTFLQQFDRKYGKYNKLNMNIDTAISSKLDLVLPALGVSVKSIAAYLRSLFWSPTIVSGELLSTESGKGISLRLRIDGKKLPDVSREENEDEVEKNLQQGAYELIEKIEPRVLALYHFFKGKQYQMECVFEKANEEFKKAIQHDDNFALAYYNWGLVLLIQDQTEEAFEKYEIAYGLQTAALSAVSEDPAVFSP